MTKDIWYKVTGMRWPTFSHIRWYSKYDVFKILGKYFPDLLSVVTEVADLGISPKNTPKGLNFLLDARKVWFLKIEVVAYVEVLSDLQGIVSICAR